MAPQEDSQMNDTNLKALVIDDEQCMQDVIIRIVEHCGHVGEISGNCFHAREKIKDDGPYDLILLDINLPDGCGFELIPEIRSHMPEIVVVTMTGYNDKELEKQARLLKAAYHLVKPFEVKELMAIIDHTAVRKQTELSA